LRGLRPPATFWQPFRLLRSVNYLKCVLAHLTKQKQSRKASSACDSVDLLNRFRGETTYCLLKTSVESCGPRGLSECTTTVKTLPSPESESFCVFEVVT